MIIIFVVTDYISFSDTITIPSGQSSASYTISLVDDDVHESTESFDVRMTLLSGQSVVILSGTSTVTIKDTDGMC